MNIFKFVFQSRGATNFARRTAQIVSRFGSSPGRMGSRFEKFLDVLDEFGVQPTFPITALPMSRNPSFARRLLERGAELAVHAWSHVDLTSLDLDEQTRHIGEAISVFRKHAVPFTGFRAPYLHWNEDTMRVVENYQFRYSSNQAVYWGVLDEGSLTPSQQDGLKKALAFYRPNDASAMTVLPYRRRGFVEIPVSLPDDEILLDRMYTDDPEFLSEVWRCILEETFRRGELFTLQLHPERIGFFAGALHGLLAEARGKKPGVWIATLDQIAGWWLEKSQNRVNFVREGDKYVADIKACAGTTVHLRNEGGERVIEPGTIAVASGSRPCVGVSPSTHRELVQALGDRGYILEVGETEGDFVVHLGQVEDSSYATLQECLKRISDCPGPLFRFGAWPHGNRSAMAVTGDVDALTIWDFLHRIRGA
jgi:peptidoglycan/xylan/chitin deacetylase (PgdA/CDA1 family)